MSEAYEPRMKTRYKRDIRSKLKEQFSYSNEMQIPRLEKIVIDIDLMRLSPDTDFRSHWDQHVFPDGFPLVR